MAEVSHRALAAIQAPAKAKAAVCPHRFSADGRLDATHTNGGRGPRGISHDGTCRDCGRQIHIPVQQQPKPSWADAVVTSSGRRLHGGYGPAPDRMPAILVPRADRPDMYEP